MEISISADKPADIYAGLLILTAMENRFTFATLAATFILGFLVFISAPKLSNVAQMTYDTADSGIIFRWRVEGAEHANELDTFNESFVKDMVNEAPVWTNMELSSEELDVILKKMADIDFISYNRVFTPKRATIGGEQTPFSHYYLEYRDETVTKIVQWNDRYYAPGNVRYNNLKELSRLIIKIVEAQPEYQELPEPTAFYIQLPFHSYMVNIQREM